MLADLARRKEGREGQAAGINTFSTSAITLVPRETARRKLNELAQSGNLRRATDGLWYLNDEVDPDAFVANVSGRLDRELDRRLAAAPPERRW